MLKNYAINVIKKVESAVPNDTHIIKHCECDRDVLGGFQWKRAIEVEMRSTG
jgi:hypothetical protein